MGFLSTYWNPTTRAVFTLAAILTVSASAQTVTATPDHPTTSTTTVAVTVTPTTGSTIKDFHFRPPVNSKLAATSVSGLPTGWSSSGETNDGINVYTTGTGITGPSTLSFTLTYTHAAGKPPDSSSIFWAMTTDGNEKIGEGTVEPKNPIGPTKTKPGDVDAWGGPGMTGSGPQIPVSSITYRNGSDGQVIIGTDVTLPIQTSVYDHVYTIHTSTALDATDDLGIDVDSPIPTNWGITISPMSSSFEEDSTGRPVATPVIRIPNDANLVGQVFYVVVTLDLDGNGRPDIRTRVRRFTVQGIGSSGSGVDDLE